MDTVQPKWDGVYVDIEYEGDTLTLVDTQIPYERLFKAGVLKIDPAVLEEYVRENYVYDDDEYFDSALP